MATRIGCDNLVYALMTTEDTVTTAPVYGAVVSAPGVMHVNINPNGAQETLFADDGPMESASTLGKIDVEIQKNQLTTQNKSDLLGHAIDSRGALVYGDTDVPPYAAIAFRTLKSNGKYRYIWLYKGKFTEPEDQNETKGDSINFQSDTISGQFMRLNKAYTVGGKTSRPWKYELDADDTGVDETTINSWFEAPKYPSTASVSSIAVTTPPTKTTYVHGEPFDRGGMVITATYSDSTTAPVTAYTVSPGGALQTTTTNVVIAYGGKTTTQAITVE